jgi:3-dehydroquinate synthase
LGKPTGVLFVSDSNVAPLHGEPVRAALASLGLTAGYVELTPGEEHKTVSGLCQILQGAFDISLDRKGLLVGLGGGVTTDMTGFAAASWVRGVRWIGLPTTLLSMVDASVGGKTGVDFHTAKNAVGAFWQPSGVICDVLTLQTETERMYRGAISEVIKTALIGDPDLLTLLETQPEALLRREPSLLSEVVERSVRVKARIVGLDERELGLRATLNLGHTIGHALESAGGFSALTHGEAVGLGLIAALRFGERRGHTPRELTARVHDLLVRLGLVHRLDEQALTRSVGLLGKDKKRAGSAVRFVFARGLGDVVTEAVQLTELEEVVPSLADPAG